MKSNRMQIKIFSMATGDLLERNINNFLDENPDVEIADVILTSDADFLTAMLVIDIS